MKASEFVPKGPVTVNIPISITIPANGGAPTVAAPAGDELPEQPIMVPPLQQEIELAKQQGGKTSKVINQIVSDDGAASEESPNPEESVQKFWSHRKNLTQKAKNNGNN